MLRITLTLAGSLHNATGYQLARNGRKPLVLQTCDSQIERHPHHSSSLRIEYKVRRTAGCKRHGDTPSVQSLPTPMSITQGDLRVTQSEGTSKIPMYRSRVSVGLGFALPANFEIVELVEGERLGSNSVVENAGEFAG